MSAFSLSNDEDSFKKFFMDNVKKEPDVILTPKPRGPPSISVGAVPGLPFADLPAVTWMAERKARPGVLPTQSLSTTTLEKILPDDNFEQLEKWYKYERVKAELEECYRPRLVAAEAEAQGRLVHWRPIVERERTEVQRRERKIRVWEQPALDAQDLLSKRHGPLDVRWILVLYIKIRQHSSVSEDEQRKSVGR
ncbi:hypothetical protein D6D24_01793 [Aureobasidium pullulans]|uniref:Uncharacterized protein n=1 Tax=Aureobasidium pullulans TaxID=5580 RepID=A0A4S8W7I3_AURPU|nr:hypothetical protein D6D24_01793 [Aureobasidium pullulans]